MIGMEEIVAKEEVLVKLADVEERLDKEVEQALRRKSEVLAEAVKQAQSMEKEEIERYSLELAEEEKKTFLELEKNAIERIEAVRNSKSFADVSRAVEFILKKFNEILDEIGG